MKFDWGRALYHALRWAVIGSVLGLVLGVLHGIGKAVWTYDAELIVSLFLLFGLARLGWEAFGKSYPDA
jgi:TctA family transporter